MREWTEAVVTGEFRVNRGGQYSSLSVQLQSSSQGRTGASLASNDIGFRVASHAFCGPVDLDCDGDVDMKDFGLFLQFFTGPQ